MHLFYEIDVASPCAPLHRYKVLHNVTFPMGSAIGDGVGILGIRHLDRYLHNHTYTDDLTIANRIWREYILGWSVRLDDGTVARKRGSCGTSMPSWPPADHAKYLWGESTRAHRMHSRVRLYLRLHFTLHSTNGHGRRRSIHGSYTGHTDGACS